MVDHGWLHLLGSGNRTHFGLIEWNTDPETMVAGLLLIALDVVGGAFAVNRNLKIGARGVVCYFSPKTLKWQSLNMTQDEFLEWVMLRDFSPFYAGIMWPGWEAEVTTLGPNHGIDIAPALSQPDPAVSTRLRMPTKLKALWHRHRDLAVMPEN